MGFSGRQIDEQSGRRLGARVGGANSVPSEHAVRNVVFIYRVGDQVFSNVCGFTRCDYPVDDIAVEYIEDRIEVTAISFDRILEPGDIPTPDLVGLQGQAGRGLGHCMNSSVLPNAHAPLAGADRFPRKYTDSITQFVSTWCPWRGTAHSPPKVKHNVVAASALLAST
jgi:hypothetical protein